MNRPVSFSPPGLCQIHSYNITQFPANYQAACGEARGLAGFQGHRSYMLLLQGETADCVAVPGKPGLARKIRAIFWASRLWSVRIVQIRLDKTPISAMFSGQCNVSADALYMDRTPRSADFITWALLPFTVYCSSFVKYQEPAGSISLADLHW